MEEIAAALPVKIRHGVSEIRILDWSNVKTDQPFSGKCVLLIEHTLPTSDGKIVWELASLYQYPTKGHWLVAETGMMMASKEGETLCVRTPHIRSYAHPPTEDEIKDFKQSFAW